MASKYTYTLALECIPDIARPIIVSTEENTTGDGEGDRGNPAKNVIVSEGIQLSIRSDVEQAA